MKEGSVVLAALAQADGQLKRRPAIVLREMPAYRDFLVCGVSTQFEQEVKDFDEIITHTDDDFMLSGLLEDSLIRLGFLALIPQRDIEGSIGAISSKRRRRLIKRLCEYLEAKTGS